MNAPLALAHARSIETPSRPARTGADAALCAVLAPLCAGQPTGTPTPEPAMPREPACATSGRPSLAVLQSQVGAALGTEAFPAVLLAVLQQAYPAGYVALRWGARNEQNAGEVSGEHRLPTAGDCAPWLETDEVAVWLPEGAGDEDLRGWLVGLIAAQRALTRAHARTDFLARLVSVLAHEVRNPLTVVMGTLELAGNSEHTPAPLRATLAAARRTAARIESITRAATEMARDAASTTGAEPALCSADHFTLKQALARAAG